MGLTDWFREAADTLKNAAAAAIHAAEQLALEAKRELERVVHEAEEVVDRVTGKVRAKAKEIEDDIRAVMPNFEGKLEEIIDDITLAASSAAEDGLDITESINAAVEIAFREIEKALEAAINAVNDFLRNAADGLFKLLEGFLPGWLNRLLAPVRSLIDWLLDGLKALSDKLIGGVKWALETIKNKVQSLVKKIGEVLGPIWNFIKKLWRLLFGAEPEQCELTAQWFDERMRRAEKEILSTEHQVVIRKRTYLEMLPPAEDRWKTVAGDFMDSCSSWSAYRAQMAALLTTPQNGHLAQHSIDEEFTDKLGGRQRIQIRMLHYRWRTEEFRKVSAGFLGILAVVSAVVPDVDTKSEIRDLDTVRQVREPPLEIDPETAMKIYQSIEAHLWLRKWQNNQEPVYVENKKARISRQIVSRDEHGWSTQQ